MWQSSKERNVLGQPITTEFELFKPLEKVMLTCKNIRTDVNGVKWDEKSTVKKGYRLCTGCGKGGPINIRY